jgi:predicted ribosomally synthesized peptide with SipW-like signal peptide
MSVLSIVLSIAMLVGTTFAWFTDTASTGINRIVAGNLDIEVEYLRGIDGEDYVWESIEDADSLFSADLWEPGHTEIVYLRVKNKGSLAFNYKMYVTPINEQGGINVYGENFKLSDYLVFKTSEPSKTFTMYSTRDEARNFAGTVGSLNQEALTQVGSMRADDNEHYIVLVVYMPEDVGNEANYMTGTTPPEIELGISFVATQMAYESDSFGNDYDEDAINEVDEYVVGPTYSYFPQVKQTAAVTKSATGVTTGDSNVVIDEGNNKVIINSAAKIEGTDDPAVTVEIPFDALQDGLSNPGIEVKKTAASDAAAETAKNEGKDIASFDISTIGLPKDDSGKLNEQVTVKLYIGKGLDGVKVFHNGTELTSGVSYDPATGYVTITSDSFSPFDILYNKAAARIGSTVYGSLSAAIGAVSSGTQETITLISDSTVDVTNNPLVIPAGKNIVLNLNGYTVTGECNSGTTSAMITNKGTLTIMDSSDRSKNGSGTGKLIAGADPTWTWEGSDDYSGSYASNLIRNEGTLTINSGYLYNVSLGSAAYAIDNYYAGKITINGGLLDAKKASAIRMFYNNGGEITVNGGIIGSSTTHMGIQVMAGTKTIVNLHGGTFSSKDSSFSFYAGFPSSSSDFSQSQFNITGGTFNNHVGFDASITDISVSGGTFKGWCGSYGNVRFITGGTFYQDPSDYVAKGYTANPDNPTNPTFWNIVEMVSAEMDGARYATIGDAISAFNEATEEKEYTITIFDGTYTESDMVIFQKPKYPGKSLTIKAQNPGSVTIKRNNDSTTDRIFLISGLSNYNGGCPITIEGIRFDISDGDGSAIYLGGGGSGAADPYIIGNNGAHRYAHDVTIRNCEFVGNETENTKALESPNRSSAAGIVIENCTGRDLGYLAEGYFADTTDGNRIALTVKGCKVSNVKALINNQVGTSTTVVEDCTVSAYHDYIVRSNGTNIIVKNSTFESTYTGSETGGVIVCRQNNQSVTVESCTFNKASLNMFDVYNKTAASTTINEEITLTRGQGHNF